MRELCRGGVTSVELGRCSMPSAGTICGDGIGAELVLG